MTECIINSPNLKVWKRMGTEGPRHDPYSFNEYEIRKTGGLTLTIHEGLGVWIRYDGNHRKPLYPIGDEDGVERSRIDALVIETCGYTIAQLERFSQKARSRCRCGHKHFETIAGYPGETLRACLKCFRIAYGTYNKAAVI